MAESPALNRSMKVRPLLDAPIFMYRDKAKRRASWKTYRDRNKTVKESQRIREDNRKRWLWEYKSSRTCVRCPENHPACLDFHHRDKSTKKISISKAVHRFGWSIKRVLEEIAKCDLLCANCHRKLHHECGDVGQRRLRLAVNEVPTW